MDLELDDFVDLSWRERIVADPEIVGGKPTIRGTRLAAELILEQLAAGVPVAEILDYYPSIATEDVLACIGYGCYLAQRYRREPLPDAPNR